MRVAFDKLMQEIRGEARREGPNAVAEITAFDAHFRSEGERLAGSRRRRLDPAARVRGQPRRHGVGRRR